MVELNIIEVHGTGVKISAYLVTSVLQMEGCVLLRHYFSFCFQEASVSRRIIMECSK
jgi:hypothetical protein